MTILGIDPGTATTGYGVITAIGNWQLAIGRLQKSEIKKRKQSDSLKLIDYGCIITKPKLKDSERLLILAKELKKIIKKDKPDLMAVEDIFFFKNLKTAIKVSQARGVILLVGQQEKIPIFEYTPLQVKQAVVGYGRAEKKQIQEMVKILLKLKETPKPDDAADALAVAICCGHSVGNGFK
jgi:crossover junction endodeoxyribonuclease RuvC